VKVSGTATDFVDNACHAHTTVPLDTLGATTAITTLNVSTTAHGLCPKAPNNTTTFLRGDATYSTIPLDGYTLQNGVYVANTFSAVKPLYNIIEIYDEFTSYSAAAGTPGSAIGTNGWSYSNSTPGDSVLIITPNGCDANKCVGVWEDGAVANITFVHCPASGGYLTGLGTAGLVLPDRIPDVAERNDHQLFPIRLS
jgi:hypothetical protein